MWSWGGGGCVCDCPGVTLLWVSAPGLGWIWRGVGSGCWSEPAWLPRAGTEERLHLSHGLWEMSSGAPPTHPRHYHSQMAALSLRQELPCFLAGAGGGTSAWASATTGRCRPPCASPSLLSGERPDRKAKLRRCRCPGRCPEEQRGNLQQRLARAHEGGDTLPASAAARARGQLVCAGIKGWGMRALQNDTLAYWALLSYGLSMRNAPPH